MNATERAKFRSTKEWKQFREYMKKLSGGKDVITGKPLYRGWNLHHLDEKNYTDLNPEKFLCLNKETHKVLHWLARYSNYEDVAVNLVAAVKKMNALINGDRREV